MSELNVNYAERKAAVPNFRDVEMPPCCGNCEHFDEYGGEYPDGYSLECRKFDVLTEYSKICDTYEGEMRVKPKPKEKR